ncbi:hypothetical protein [Streptomyces sp. NBC_01497]|uniref:hypothetical protein n=1 Tax=Streptomyces sp. NBC_01497 TaxID=2903885 RepID=UPI002E37B351|nr:hypothetical protein [Streptomyces sp. NBC_01497]
MLRLVVDHPEDVSRAAFVDRLPLTEHLSRVMPELAVQWGHWFFFAQPDVAERMTKLPSRPQAGGLGRT